jgi:hypothetical protein
MTQTSSAPTLRALLASYDRGVEEILQETLDAQTGTDRVALIHQLRRSVAVHDSIVRSVLCPLLDDLPDGLLLSNRLRDGCQERSDLLTRFRKVSNGVAIHNVYPTNRAEIDAILDGLTDSFRRHEHSETTEVAGLLESSSESDDPEVIATLMALEAGRAPTRSHRAMDRHPESSIRKKIYHSIDRLHNWNDSHHGWRL